MPETLIKIARRAVHDHAYQLIKPIPRASEDPTAPQLYETSNDPVEMPTEDEEEMAQSLGVDSKPAGFTLLDAFTASAIVAVYDAVSPDGQAKLMAMPMMKCINTVWRAIERSRAGTPA